MYNFSEIWIDIMKIKKEAALFLSEILLEGEQGGQKWVEIRKSDRNWLFLWEMVWDTSIFENFDENWPGICSSVLTQYYENINVKNC